MSDGVSSIATIAPIATILPIQAGPQAARVLVSPDAFNVLDLPANVQQMFRRNGSTAWRDAARTAVAEGVGPQKVADVIFFMVHRERVTGDIGKPIAPAEPAFVKLRAEWELYFTIAQRLVRPSRVPDFFLPAQASRKYEEFIAAQTTGKVTLMVHGRNWDGKGAFRDVTDTYDEMQRVVDSLGSGDTLYIANWQFAPWAVPIPANASSTTRTWQNLLTEKAAAGVTIRIIIALHPFGSIFMTDIPSVDVMINALPAAQIDNFKYLVSAHPDPLGSHHQKFMVARKGKNSAAFCGGLDLSFNRVPQRWGFNFVWHDVAAKLEGLIAHDLERQFVELWNRDRLSTPTTLLKGWKPHEKLTVSASGDDKAGALNQHAAQLQRTVSLGPNPGQVQRDDIWRGYFRVIGRATRFLYLENQYFFEPALADAILKQVQSAPGMIVMIVSGTGTDDRTRVDPTATGFDRIQQEALVDVAQNQFALRFEFFKRLQVLDPAQVRVYTLNYPNGITHTKLILGDDEVLSLGSANANPRGFFTDTEVNFALDHPETVRAFRHQLWAHNLGSAPTDVAKWGLGEFFKNWDAVAKSNLRRQKTPTKMAGEGVIPFHPWDPKDLRFERGIRGPIRVPLVRPRVFPDGIF